LRTPAEDELVFFDIAALWHKMYALNIEMKVESGEACSAESDKSSKTTLCYLGRWLTGYGSMFRPLRSYRTLVESHDHFHTQAGQMLRQHADGNHPLAGQIRQGEYRSASLAVVSAIDLLASDIARVEGKSPKPDATDPEIKTICELTATPIGIPVLDQQHALLAGLTEVLLSQATATLDSHHVQEILNALTSSVELHFETEEAYMRHIGMPQLAYASHLTEHARILDAMNRLVAQASVIKTITVADLRFHFRQWMGAHLLDFDYIIRRYAGIH
jgi:hemerythrin-like metal-binding protein